jgi:excisionase family DNA binding protein
MFESDFCALIIEDKEMEEIAYKVSERLKAMLPKTEDNKQQDIIFDVKGLADYLKVEESWVYKQISLKTIPFFKVGKYTRFKKSAIDRWADNRTIKPISPLKLIKGGN